MRFGFVLPGGDARLAAEYAALAESSGWDGFFVWEPLWGFDAWVSLAAAALTTQHIRLGTMITPLSRMRPWKLASETLTLDHLSAGRLVLSVGLGALETGFDWFGEVTDRRQRAQLLDEGLDLLVRLWQGQPFDYDGEHYHVHVPPNPSFPLPPPSVQQPRIPIWVVAAWPSPKSLSRALRFDGLLPNFLGSDGKVRMDPPTPQEVSQLSAYIQASLDPPRPFDLVVEGQTPGDRPKKARAQVQPFIDAGATWWIEALWNVTDDQVVQRRIQQGPPRLQS